MQILEEPCSQLRAPLQCSREMIYLRINLIPVVKARDGQKSNVFLPVPCKFTRHFTRRTLQNGNDTRYTPTLFFVAMYGNLIFLGRHFRAGFTRGNHEDVWENMYGDARGILTGGEKGNFVILWFPSFHGFEWNRVVRQDKSCSCAIFKLRLKLKFFFLSLSLLYIFFRFSHSFLFQILRLKFIFVGNSKSKFFNLGSLSAFFSKFCREINGKESTSGNLF